MDLAVACVHKRARVVAEPISPRYEMVDAPMEDWLGNAKGAQSLRHGIEMCFMRTGD